MTTYDQKTTTPDTGGAFADGGVLFGALNQTTAVPVPFSDTGLIAWIKSKFTKTDVGLSNVLNIKHNISAVADPTTTADSASNYSVGSLWFRTDTGACFKCVDATASAAVWVRMVPGKAAGQLAAFAETTGQTGVGPIGAGTIGSLTLTNNRLYMVPFIVTERRQFTTINVSVVTREAGKHLRIGIYNANQETRQPTTLILETATPVDLDTTTGSVNRNAKTISQVLQPGLYYMAFISDATGTAVVSGCTVSAYGFMGWNVSSGGTWTPVTGMFNASTYGAFSGIHSGDESAVAYSIATSYPAFVLF